MGRVSVEGSHIFANLNSQIDNIKCDMQDNLDLLNNAFSIACESWKDVNARVCEAQLENHNAEMRAALGKLGDIQKALSRLVALAGKYEDI